MTNYLGYLATVCLAVGLGLGVAGVMTRELAVFLSAGVFLLLFTILDLYAWAEVRMTPEDVATRLLADLEVQPWEPVDDCPRITDPGAK